MSQTVCADAIRIREIKNPDIGLPQDYPVLTVEVYRARLERLQQRMKERELDAVVVYGDREHAANFAWVTGFEPRFEEAIAVVPREGLPTVLLGNECLSLSEWTNAEVKAVHWPPLSLISQPRDGTRPLRDLLREAGLANGQAIGLAGWKCYGAAEFDEPERAFETPSYLVEALRDVTGSRDRVTNATDLFMSPENGLRTENEPAEIARLEFAASLVSQGIADLLSVLEPGKTELELAECLNSKGLPLSCHPMVSSGGKASYGLTSPSSNVVRLGDPFTTAFGLCGGLTCRAGYVAASPADLPSEFPNWVEQIAKPFYAAVVSWYQTIRIGLSGGELFDLVESLIPRSRFGWVLNPGHLLGMDEWISSPVNPGSAVSFRSGMAVQMDIIPAPPDGCSGGNVEDGIVLADGSLRERLAAEFPDVWARVQKRRGFMSGVLGIRLHESVLPLSSIPALWHPLLMNRKEALAVG